MQIIKQNIYPLFASLIFILAAIYFIWEENYFFFGLPIALGLIYLAIYHTKQCFYLILFITPLSVNIEEYTDSFGLFIPTEPLLFGMLILLFFQGIKGNVFPKYIWKNPIIWTAIFYLLWILFTTITSELPIVSVKFLLVRLWFFVPVLFYGTIIFKDRNVIHKFLWLFSTGMIITMLYTLFMHASYRFGEQEGHWVMWPFFKDHTIYGALVALVLPLIVALYFSKKHTPLIQATLIFFITVNLFALYFSYTRAAWLSVVVAIIVWGLIYMRIKFSFLLLVSFGLGLLIFFSWDTIQRDLSKNKQDHTTENFGERLQSASNVSTDASNLERINRWTCAIDMFKERPIFGFGPGTYAFEYARFQRPENRTIISTNFGDGGNAHSEYLGALAEMGILGLLSVLLLVGAIFYKGITLYNKWPNEDKEFKIIILAMNLSLVTYFVHGFLNNYLDTDKAAVPIWAICACFIALEHQLHLKLKHK
jgi:putative inorganic carbon (hco3(-)) transporter